MNPKHVRKLRLTFPATGESAIAEMLETEAPAVCDYIWGRFRWRAKPCTACTPAPRSSN